VVWDRVFCEVSGDGIQDNWRLVISNCALGTRVGRLFRNDSTGI
jgi:hypothetical protein